MNETYALQALGIDKSFSGIQVLDQVDFSVRRGEVHGLMGENGAGKSTLIKILTGAYTKDAGKILIDSEEVMINSRQDAAACGISVIYQELSVVESLSVAQNICLGQEKTKGIVLAEREMKQNVQELIDRYQFDLHPDDLVGSLSIAKRQTVEILKAISTDAKIIIMDEPTASLTPKESEILFGIIRRMRDEGKSIIYISHRLDEINLLVDRLTVLRNGQVVGVREFSKIDPVEIIHLMIGKELNQNTKQYHEPVDGGNVLEVKGLCIGGVLRGVSFEARGGQILGIGGLMGSGRTEILKSIFGLADYDAGEITLNGRALSRKPKKNAASGIGYIPEDRRAEGVVQNMSIERNLALASLDQWSRGRALMQNRRAKAAALACMERVDIRPRIPELASGLLSGGNQQKVVLGKWLMRGDLKLLLVDEPTVGIDIGARAQIYSILESLAEKGVVILVVSSDLQELLTISDRIMVMYRGRVFKQFQNVGLTQKDILAASAGISEEVAR